MKYDEWNGYTLLLCAVTAKKVSHIQYRIWDEALYSMFRPSWISLYAFLRINFFHPIPPMFQSGKKIPVTSLSGLQHHTFSGFLFEVESVDLSL